MALRRTWHAYAVVVGIASTALMRVEQAPVIENPAPDPDARAYRLSSAPIIAVGGLNDDERYEILRIADATLTPSGRLVVATGRGARPGSRLRVFTPPGRFVRAFGREGQGPGEFVRISGLTALAGDSLLVYDSNLRRLTLFDSLGTVVRTTRDAGSMWRFSDGSYLVVANPGPNTVAPVEPGEVIARDTIVLSLGRAGDIGIEPERILSLPGYQRPVCVTRSPNSSRCRASVLPPFAVTPTVATAGDEIVYGDGERYEYRVYSRTGALLRIVRAAAPRVRITPQDIAAARQEWLGRGGLPDQQARAAAWAKLSIPDARPAYSRLLTDDDGAVWIGSRSTSGSDQLWARFDRAGRLLGTLRVPADLTVFRFVRGHAILSHYDPDEEAQKVFVHRIEGPSGT